MTANRKEMVELILGLIDSTCNYVAPRIQGDSDRFAYVRAVSRCFAVCNTLEDDFNKMRLELLRMMYASDHPVKFEFFSSNKKYYKMGIEHVLDIVECISRRFDVDNHISTDKSHTRSVLNVFNDTEVVAASKDKRGTF